MKSHASAPVPSAYRAARVALGAALIAVCAWITVPAPIPFTMQTFGVFLTLLLLEGAEGPLAVTVYLLLGLMGVPVFSAFRGGLGVLLGPGGGYLVGFWCMALVYRLMTRRSDVKPVRRVAALVMGLLLCYVLGTAWYVVLAMTADGAVAIGAALVQCVVPFVLPDALKLAAACGAATRLKKRIRF